MVVQGEGRKQEYPVSSGNKLYANLFVCQPITLPPQNEFWSSYCRIHMPPYAYYKAYQ